MSKRKDQRKTTLAHLRMDEHQEQAALFRWAELQKARWPELDLLHAIPNGGRRDKVTGARLKAEGVKPGVPDVFLPVARSGQHGLYIELKTNTGRASSNQLRWMQALLKQGFYVAICKGWIEASRLITAYLSGKPELNNETIPKTTPRTITRRRNNRPGQLARSASARRRSRLRYAGKENRVD